MPNGDADRVIWLGNFKTKLPTYAALTGITPAEVTATINDYIKFKLITLAYSLGFSEILILLGNK